MCEHAARGAPAQLLAGAVRYRGDQVGKQSPSERHPIIAGVIALAGVGLIIGAVSGMILVAGSNVLGAGDGTGTADAQATMSLPKPSKSTASQDSPGPGAGTLTPAASPGQGSGGQGQKPKRKITLTASPSAAVPMGTVALSGSYLEGKGVVLSVQRRMNGKWYSFPASGAVQDDGQFHIPVQTGQTGENHFRVIDTDSGRTSHEVTVTITG
jgi:VCBS repeat-containing protein